MLFDLNKAFDTIFFFRYGNTSYSSPHAPYPSPSTYPSPVDAATSGGYHPAASSSGYYEAADSSLLPHQAGEISSTEELAATYIREFEEAYRGLPNGSDRNLQCNTMLPRDDSITSAICDSNPTTNSGYYILPDYSNGYSDPDTTLSYPEQEFLQPGEIFNLEQPIVPDYSNYNSYPPRLANDRIVHDTSNSRLSPLDQVNSNISCVNNDGKELIVERLSQAENPRDYHHLGENVPNKYEENPGSKYQLSNNNNVDKLNIPPSAGINPFSSSMVNYTDKGYITSVGLDENHVERQTLEWSHSPWTAASGYTKQSSLDYGRMEAEHFNMFDVNLQVTN